MQSPTGDAVKSSLYTTFLGFASATSSFPLLLSGPGKKQAPYSLLCKSFTFSAWLFLSQLSSSSSHLLQGKIKPRGLMMHDVY
jgi:hypothetical protein